MLKRTQLIMIDDSFSWNILRCVFLFHVELLVPRKLLQATNPSLGERTCHKNKKFTLLQLSLLNFRKWRGLYIAEFFLS